MKQQLASPLLILLCAISAARAQTLSDMPFHGWVPIAPTPVKADGKIHLLYELYALNVSATAIKLTRLEVLPDDTTARPLANYRGAELSHRFVVLDDADKPVRTCVIPSQRAGMIYLQLVIATEVALPSALRHRLYFKDESSDTRNSERRLEVAPVSLQRDPPLVLAAPLRGNGWRAVEGFSNDSHHRRALIPHQDRLFIPQRYGIDWAKVGPNGAYCHEGVSKNENCYGYGEEVLAVADAIVADVRDGMPENIPHAKESAVPFSLDSAAGNFIMLDLGQSRFALYAHLQPNSLRVKVGDHVHQGQVLASVGNSGNATGPHLHFHVGNANAPLFSEGMPYVFESFAVQVPSSLSARHTNKRRKQRRGTNVVIHRMEMPASEAVVNFPNETRR